MFSELREEILSESDFAEVAAYRTDTTDANGTAFTCRFVREDPGPLISGQSENVALNRGLVKCLATVHVTLGGIVAPVAGLELKLARVFGATTEWGWKVESVRGGLSGWDLEVVLRDRLEAGGKRMERGQ